ncbi:MAG: hypothetical protein V7645_2525 [Actinomycetota bacterium]|jgi:hypothetical protein
MPPPSLLPISGETRTLWTAAGSAVEDIVDAVAVFALLGLVGPAAVDLGGEAAVVPAVPPVDKVARGDKPTVNVGVATIEALDCTVFVNAATVVSAMSATTRDGAAAVERRDPALVSATAAVRSTTFVIGGWTVVVAADTTASTFDVASTAVCTTGAVAAWTTGAIVACCTGAAAVCTGAAAVCTGAAAVCTGAGAVGTGVAFAAGALGAGTVGAGALGAGALGSAALVVTAAGSVAAVTVGTADTPGSAARATPANAAKQAMTPAMRIDRASLLARMDMRSLFPACGHISRNTGSGPF